MTYRRYAYIEDVKTAKNVLSKEDQYLKVATISMLGLLVGIVAVVVAL